MKILIIFIIVHIVCSLIAKKSVYFIFENTKKRDSKVIITGDGEELDNKLNDFVKKLIPHIPILNIIISILTIRIYLYHYLKPKK